MPRARKVELRAEWTHRTPLRTIHFPAGRVSMDEEAYQAALDWGVIEGKVKDNGDGPVENSEAGSPADPES